MVLLILRKSRLLAGLRDQIQIVVFLEIRLKKFKFGLILMNCGQMWAFLLEDWDCYADFGMA